MLRNWIPHYTADRNIKQYRHSGKNSGSCLQYSACTYHTTQQSHSQAPTSENGRHNVHTKPVLCSKQFYSYYYTKYWKQAKCPSMDEWLNKLGTSIQWNILLSDSKKLTIDTCSNTKRTSRVLYLVKKVDIKGLHTISFHSYNLFE